MIISLVGVRGCGKSTIGSILSKQLFCKHIDLDNYIEKSRDGESISQLFATEGEARFREYEEGALRELLENNREKVLVISLGGGTLISPSNRALIAQHTYPIYLRCKVDTLHYRLSKNYRNRPLLEDLSSEQFRERIVNLLHEREEGYQAVASLTLDIDNLSIREIVEQIMDSFR